MNFGCKWVELWWSSLCGRLHVYHHWILHFQSEQKLRLNLGFEIHSQTFSEAQQHHLISWTNHCAAIIQCNEQHMFLLWTSCGWRVFLDTVGRRGEPSHDLWRERGREFSFLDISNGIKVSGLSFRDRMSPLLIADLESCQDYVSVRKVQCHIFRLFLVTAQSIFFLVTIYRSVSTHFIFKAVMTRPILCTP